MRKTLFYLENTHYPVSKHGFVSPGIIFGKYEGVKWVEHVENSIVKSVFFFRNNKVYQYNAVQ